MGPNDWWAAAVDGLSAYQAVANIELAKLIGSDECELPAAYWYNEALRSDDPALHSAVRRLREHGGPITKCKFSAGPQGELEFLSVSIEVPDGSE